MFFVEGWASLQDDPNDPLSKANFEIALHQHLADAVDVPDGIVCVLVVESPRASIWAKIYVTTDDVGAEVARLVGDEKITLEVAGKTFAATLEDSLADSSAGHRSKSVAAVVIIR